ncbi:transglutaminase-like cysteine peptidase [Psychromonas sp. 14N.309.X.WAT.B.A12]|jgi:predicted transglutaminase-like cysteine proteinase|uniref:transglutaminase-like cysteine peptidase n=1 Tax=unclassified Psychromonas TaxID=2614957 RepID=UPI00339D95A4
MLTILLLYISNLYTYASSSLSFNTSKLISTLTKNYGERAALRGKAWLKLLNASYENEHQKLLRTNRFFNQLRFTTDKKLWGESNYWATPVEFIGVNAGDCEDFALAKYFTLLAIGVDDDKLRIVMVKSLTLNQYHMVVAYYETPTSEPLILDNIDGRIKKSNDRKDLVPVYSFNGTKLWLNNEKRQGRVAGKPSRLKRWNDLNLRMGLNKLKQPVLSME